MNDYARRGNKHLGSKHAMWGSNVSYRSWKGYLRTVLWACLLWWRRHSQRARPTIAGEGCGGLGCKGKLTLSLMGSREGSGGGGNPGVPRQRCGSSEVGSQSKGTRIEKARGSGSSGNSSGCLGFEEDAKGSQPRGSIGREHCFIGSGKWLGWRAG